MIDGSLLRIGLVLSLAEVLWINKVVNEKYIWLLMVTEPIFIVSEREKVRLHCVLKVVTNFQGILFHMAPSLCKNGASIFEKRDEDIWTRKIWI